MTISPENLTAWRTEAEHVITNSSPINDITAAARIIALLNALEQAEQEVEHLRTVLDTTARQRDEADKWVAKVVKERDQAIADQHMTADQHLAAAVAHGVTVTDEMVERARLAYNAIEPYGAWREGIRAALTAALTKPQRPEGAEDVQALIDEWADGWGCASDPSEDGNHGPLADFLASRGVRVEGSGR